MVFHESENDRVFFYTHNILLRGYQKMNKNFPHSLIVLTLILSFLLTACQPNVESPAPTEVPAEIEAVPTEAAADVPTEAATAVPTAEIPEVIAEGIQLDPAILDNKDLLLACSYIYEGLVKLEDISVEPVLASSWTISDDELDYIFELRPDVTFQDGTRLDADLVIANFNRWFDPENSLHNVDATFSGWQDAFLGFKGEMDANNAPKSSFDGIEKVNNLTILIHLNRQDPEFLQKIALPQFGFIIPDLLADEGNLFATSQGSVVGTGPYVVAEWTNESIVLLPNADYWDTPPVPKLEFPLP